MARNGRYAPAQSIERSQTAFAANGAPSSTPTFVRSSKQREDKRSAPSTPSASPCEANRCIAPLERPKWEREQLPCKIILECFQSLPIHSSCAVIGLYCLVCFVHSPLFNPKRLVYRTDRSHPVSSCFKSTIT